MAFDINNFLQTNHQYGFMRNNRFQIQFACPTILQSTLIGTTLLSSYIQLLQMRGSEARLPGVILQTADIQRYGFGPLQKFPVNPIFTDSSLTFIGDRNGFIFQFFYQWLNGINDFSGSVAAQNDASYLIEYKSNYVTDMYITIFDEFGNTSLEVVLYECYPVSLNDIPLSWEDNDTILKMTVGLTFRDWSLVPTNTSSTSSSTIA